LLRRTSFENVEAKVRHRVHLAVLCCAVLCCAVLCCAVLCCAVLCCAVLCCAVGCRCAVSCARACCVLMRVLMVMLTMLLLSLPSSTPHPQWIPEIRHHAPDTPFILVATKADLRDSPDWNVKYKADAVSAEEGSALAKKLGAVAFMECSALTQKGLKAIFDEAIRVGLQKQVRRRCRARCVCARVMARACVGACDGACVCWRVYLRGMRGMRGLRAFLCV
jgi:hypothetical protein